MATRDTAVERIERAVTASLPPPGPYVIAVSGGRDSMVLLDAFARTALTGIVAAFDHGTGEAATRAAALVAGESALRRLPCVVGRAGRLRHDEAGWREARWEFLRDVAHSERAVVATAHTRDDQLETMVIRVLRDAGARGLAGLYATSVVRRPLIDVSRSDVAEYASARQVVFVEDPTNVSRRHLRNRVRLDLLPAIERVRPSFGDEMLAIARRAAQWREAVRHTVDALSPQLLDEHTIRIAATSLRGYDAASLRVLWPEVAARAGVTMDRRGTERAAAFTIDRIAALTETGDSKRPDAGAASPHERGGRGGRGRVIQLSGGAEIEYVAGAFVLRRR